LKAKGEHEAVLIVAPKPTWEAWEEECELEGVLLQPLDGPVRERIRDVDLSINAFDVHWFITNYEGLFERRSKGEDRTKPKPSELALFDWDAIILDESTKIRDARSNTSKIAVDPGVFARAEYRAILTGLPNPEGPEDYYQQMKFLYGRFLGCRDFWQFRHRYFEQQGFDWIPKPGVIGLIKERISRQAYTLTRKQAGLGNRKIYECRYVDLPQKVRNAMNDAERKFAVGEIETKYVPVTRVWMARLAGGCFPDFEHTAKLDELTYLLTTELRREQAVVWFRFNDELHAASAALTKAGVSNVRLHGGVGRDLRKERLDLCRKRRRRVALVQLKLGRFGLNYSFASTAIYYSQDYEHEVRAQSEDRIEHITKQQPLLYIDLLARDSIDEDIREAQRTKAGNAAVFRSLFLRNVKRRVAKRERKRVTSRSAK
jgi:SNF2 family DNA or RNA helicase